MCKNLETSGHVLSKLNFKFSFTLLFTLIHPPCSVIGFSEGQLFFKLFFCCLFILVYSRVILGNLWRSQRDATGELIHFILSETECTNLNKWPTEYVEALLLKWCGVLSTGLIWWERWRGVWKTEAPVTSPLFMRLHRGCSLSLSHPALAHRHTPRIGNIHKSSNTHVLNESAPSVSYCLSHSHTHTHTHTCTPCSANALSRWDVQITLSALRGRAVTDFGLASVMTHSSLTTS